MDTSPSPKQLSAWGYLMSKKRKRRVCDASFRLEAVRRYEERRALQVPASVIAQDLGVRATQLRSLAQQVAARAGQAPPAVFPG